MMKTPTPTGSAGAHTQTTFNAPIYTHVSQDTGNCWIEVMDDDFAITRPGDLSREQCDCIVRAVNSHDALVAALENLLETVEWLTMSGNIKSPIEPHPYGMAVIMAKQDARAALARARGE